MVLKALKRRTAFLLCTSAGTWSCWWTFSSGTEGFGYVALIERHLCSSRPKYIHKRMIIWAWSTMLLQPRAKHGNTQIFRGCWLVGISVELKWSKNNLKPTAEEWCWQGPCHLEVWCLSRHHLGKGWGREGSKPSSSYSCTCYLGWSVLDKMKYVLKERIQCQIICSSEKKVNNESR